MFVASTQAFTSTSRGAGGLVLHCDVGFDGRLKWLPFTRTHLETTMANRSIKIHEWSSCLEPYRRSGSILAHSCRDEQVSVRSFGNWRNRLASMHLESDEDAI